MRTTHLFAAAFVGIAAPVIAAPPPPTTECIPTVTFPVAAPNPFGGPGGFSPRNQMCSGTNEGEDKVLLMTQVKELQAQNRQLLEVVSALRELAQANREFRDTFRQVVVDNQMKMRDDVLSQLAALPGRVATDQAVVTTLATAVATHLAADNDFRRRLKDEQKGARP